MIDLIDWIQNQHWYVLQIKRDETSYSIIYIGAQKLMLLGPVEEQVLTPYNS